MTGVCGGLIADISRKLPENAEWQMELLDESRKPVVRIRLIAETCRTTTNRLALYPSATPGRR
jgi:hypothetical protein